MPQKNKKNILKIRRTWKINPKTRVKEDEKKYKRSREKERKEKDIKEELKK